MDSIVKYLQDEEYTIRKEVMEVYSWNFDKATIMSQTKKAIMDELVWLLEPERVREDTANYWLDNAHNVFAYVEIDGRESWIEIRLELYDSDEDWIGDLYCYNTLDLSIESLEEVVEEVVQDYYGE